VLARSVCRSEFILGVEGLRVVDGSLNFMQTMIPWVASIGDEMFGKDGHEARADLTAIE